MRLNSDQVTVKVRSGHGGQEHRGFLLGLELTKLGDREMVRRSNYWYARAQVPA